MRKYFANISHGIADIITPGVFRLGLAFAMGSTMTAAEAARFTLVSPQAMAVEGLIELGDCERFEAAIKPTVTKIVLNSKGGRVGQGKCISRSIAARRLTTYVQGKCASICFLLFAAGAQKWACEDAQIGVHHARVVESGKEGDVSSIIEYANRYRVPAAIQRKLSDTSSHDMYWLSASDLTSMNVRRCPSAVVSTIAEKPPSAVGITVSAGTHSAPSSATQAGASEDCNKLRGAAAVTSCTLVVALDRDRAAAVPA